MNIHTHMVASEPYKFIREHRQVDTGAILEAGVYTSTVYTGRVYIYTTARESSNLITCSSTFANLSRRQIEFGALSLCYICSTALLLQ